MKDNRTENGKVTAETAEAEVNNAAAELGKFKDVQALMDAYQALEAEFTRRSQRLKELEASNERISPAKTDNPAVHSQEAETEKLTQAKEEAKSQPAAALSDEVKRAVIEEYLNGVCQSRGVPFLTGGCAVAAVRRTPTTMKEAGALAGKLFSDKEDK